MKRPRRVAGLLILIAGAISCALSWLVAYVTFHPGWGFERNTVPATVVALASIAAIALGAALLDRPVVVSVLCIGVTAVVGAAVYRLAQDIPFADARDYASFREVYRSRVLALQLAGVGAAALGGVGIVGLRGRVHWGDTGP